MLDWLSTQFLIPQNALLIDGQYSPGLVALSVLIAVFASFMGFTVAGQAASSPNKIRKQILLCVGSLALGGGIWAMHFIGMLAFDLCAGVSYDPTVTLLSMLPGILAAWVALHNLVNNQVTLKQIVIAGILVGAGIGAMHYTGMAAMEMAPLLRYSIPMFLLSLVVAIALAMVALWIRYGLSHLRLWGISDRLATLVASTVMGLAIAGMHYTGMSAARFVRPPGLELSEQGAEISLYLASGVTFFTGLMIATVLGISLLFKYKDISQRADDAQRTQLAIMDTAIDGVLTVDGEGLVLSMNKAVTRILGWTPEDLIGKPVTQVIPPRSRYKYDGNFFSQRAVPIEEQIVGVSRDVTMLNREGEEIPLRIGVGHTIVGEENYFVAFLADIRDRLKIEAALRENEAKFRSFINNIPGIAYRCLDQDGWPMEFISHPVEAITGYPADDFILPSPKRSFADLFHPDDIEHIEKAVQKRSNFSMEYRIITRDGSIKWMREHGTYVISEDGKTTWLDGFIMDITPRRVMENELVEAKIAAEQAAAARTAFLANMSHEIRTPMNAIMGFSDLLLDEELTLTQQKHLSTINRAARSLLHLLNDILDSAKLDKGKLDLEYRDFVLIDEVDTVISTFRLEAERKGLALQLYLDPSLVVAYHGVPERIRQVLSNLVGNAVKFTHKGSVRVAVNVKRDNQIEFAVSDTGIGMTGGQLEKVFDAFAQADASMSRKYGGTGLGTTISKQLVELMGGTISATSEVDKGSEFRFMLPLVPAKQPVLAKRSNNDSRLPPLSVLIVDDIEQNLDLLMLLLSRAGHKVVSARNGEEALEKMASETLDVVLMDLQMPVMDGLAAARRRREFERACSLPQLPIIALTASVLSQDKRDATSAGMEGFANKPIDFPTLCAEIARVLNIHFEPVKNSNAISAAENTVIDGDQGASLWGSASTHIKEVSAFINSFEIRYHELEQAIIERNYPDIRELSHGLKGVCGNLCLLQMMHLFSNLEYAAHGHRVPGNICSDIKAAFERVKEMALSMAGAPGTQLEGEFDITEFTHHVTVLAQSVAQNQVDDQSLILLASMPAGPYKLQVEAILTDLDDFEFTIAKQRLNTLLSTLSKVEG